MIRPVHTLLVIDDDHLDREQYRHYLMSDLSCTYRLLEAESATAGLVLCCTQAIDAILLNSKLPDANGLEFLEAMSAQISGEHPPVVMVADGDRTVPSVALSMAIQAIKLGAKDYLLKQLLTPESLQLAVRSAIENTRLRLQLRQCNDRFRVSIENMLDCFGIFSAIRDESGRIIDFRFDYLNATALQNNEMTPADLSKTLCEVLPAHRHTGLFEAYCQVVETGKPLLKEDFIYSDVFGTQHLTRAYDVRANKLGDGFVASWRNVTAKKQAEFALQEANRQMTTIWESMTDAYVTLDRAWRIVYANPRAIEVIRQITDLEPEEFLGKKTHWEVFPWSIGQITEREYRRAVAEQTAVHFEVLYEPSGDWFEVHAYPSNAGLGIYFRDVTKRKQAEETARQQLAEIESIYKTAPVGLCFVDTDLRFVRINEQLAKINGLSVSEHLGRTLREVLPEMADRLEPIYRQVIASGEPILNLEVQGTNRAQPDVLRHWSVSYHPQKDMNQRVIGVNVMVDEITDRKRRETAQKEVEVALYESERRFREIFNTTFQFVGLLTPDGILLEANQTALDFAGLTCEEAINRPFWEVRWWTLSQETQQQLQDAIAQAAQGEFVRYEVEVLGVGEITTIIDFSLKPVRDESGQVVLLIPEGRDISDIKRNEQRLRESEAQLQMGVQVAGVALARFDYTSNTVTLSPEAAVLYGIPSDELTITRDRIHATFHPDDLAELAQIIQQVIDPAGSGWFAHDHRVVWQDGEVRWLSVRKQVFFDRSSEVPRPDYAILAAIDITDRKQTEAERDRLLAESEAANQSKDEFVALVAHELRSPLNSISGWAKLLQTRRFDDATTTKALDTIYRNTQAQVQLVEDLLDISRMVKGTLQLNWASVNLVEVIEAALDLVRPMAEAKNIQLQIQSPVSAPISGDFNRLQQIAVNLLTNAIKFTPNGGRVEIGLETVESQVQFRIRDTGKGIAAEFLPMIFERFKQGQQNTGSKDGLGLGLAIVKNLVELHQGTITAESEGTGQGSTFTVCLPRLETLAVLQEAQPLSLDAATLAGIRVLAVDDQPDMLNLIKFVLEEFGAEVQAVTTAAAALERLSQFKPDILVSDIAMPEGNGYELVQQMKSYPEGQIPAIALTAYASATHRERSLLAGFQQHLTKPVEPEDIVTAIWSLVRKEKP
jgi:PAS domain S-box-containing protein